MATKNFKTRETSSWNPTLDTLGAISYKAGTGNPFSVIEHDDNHKYLYLKCAIANLNDTTIGVLAAGHMMISNGTKWINKALSGDATIDSTGAVTVSKINSVNIVLGDTLTTFDKFTTTVGDVTLAAQAGGSSVTLPATGTLMSSTLTAGKIWIGTAGVAAEQAVSGVIVMSNTGVTTWSAPAITNTQIAATTVANIDWNKLAAGTASRVVVTDGSGYPTSSTVTTTELGYLTGNTGGNLQAQITAIINGTVTLAEINVGAGDINLNTNAISFDADENTYIYSSADDTINIYISAASDFSFTANSFNILSGSAITMATTAYIGLAPGAGRITFTDAATDTITIGDANLVLGSNELIFTTGESIVGGGTYIGFTVEAAEQFKLNNGSISLSKSMTIDITGFNLTISGTGNSILLGAAADKLGFFGTIPTVVSSGWSVTNMGAGTYTINHDQGADATNCYKVVATLMTELLAKGLISA